MTPIRAVTARAAGGSAPEDALCALKIPADGIKFAVAAAPAAVGMASVAVEAVLVCVTDAAHIGSVLAAWGPGCWFGSLGPLALKSWFCFLVFLSSGLG